MRSAAGGRYDNLVESLGGRATPGVGFGSGIERLLIALEAQQVPLTLPVRPLVYLISQSGAAKAENLKLLRQLRHAGFCVDVDLAGRSMKAQFKLADREKATVVLVTGDAELAAGTVALKSMATGEQQAVPKVDLVATLGRILGR